MTENIHVASRTYTADMKNKLQKIIDDGKVLAPKVMESIAWEYDHRRDYLVKPEKIEYNVNGGLTAWIGDIETRFTNHSRRQLLEKIGMPSRYYDMLTTPPKNEKEHYKIPHMKELASANINKLTQLFADDGLMFRVVDNTLTKGVLSPSFGRYDASPLFASFIRECLNNGYVPMDGKNSDYRYTLTYIIPDLTEIAPGEYIVFAITFTTSDYGSGANDISLSVLRVWCKNLAVGFSLLRKVHIGSRFNDVRTFVEMSDTTHNLDVRTIASAITDIVRKSTKMIPEFRQLLETAAIENRDYPFERVLNQVQKNHGKDIADTARSLYLTSGISELPQAPGSWRMSNVLSLMAQDSNRNADAQIDLQREAFNILKIAA